MDHDAAQRYSLRLDDLPVATCVVNQEGTIRDANRRFVDLCDTSRDDLLNRPCPINDCGLLLRDERSDIGSRRHRIITDDRCVIVLVRVKKFAVPAIPETPLWMLTAEPVHGLDRDHRRLQTIRSLISGWSHEVRQPLSAVSNYATALNIELGRRDDVEPDWTAWTHDMKHACTCLDEMLMRLRHLITRTPAPAAPLSDPLQITSELMRWLEYEGRQRGVSFTIVADGPSLSLPESDELPWTLLDLLLAVVELQPRGTLDAIHVTLSTAIESGCQRFEIQIQPWESRHTLLEVLPWERLRQQGAHCGARLAAASNDSIGWIRLEWSSDDPPSTEAP